MAGHILLPILAYFIHKNNFSNIFWALSEGPRGSRPTSSNLSPYDTHLRIFPRLSTAILTKDFTQALPTSNVTPSRIPRSDPPPCVTYIRSFWLLSSSILTLAFTQALPTSNVTSKPTLPSDPPIRVAHPRIFSRLSTSILTNLIKFLLRHSLPLTSSLHQHHHRIPLLALCTLGFFPVSVPPF